MPLCVHLAFIKPVKLTMYFRLCSCVGVWQNDRVEIIANDQGNRTTPSYVAFTDTERLIGDAAKNQTAMNPRNTVFDAKRLIGRKFTDHVVQDDMKHWPFKVKPGAGDKPFIEGNCYFLCTPEGYA
jgi:heat shock 70kDa protein 1/2/6/8